MSNENTGSNRLEIQRKGRAQGVAASIRSAAVVLLAVILAFSVDASEKKGVGLADLNAADRLAALNVAWYYTWKPYPIKGAPENKFVPMVSGRHRARLNPEIAEMRANSKAPIMLAINEPDRPEQANMSVEETVRRWPEIENLANRVSSPAPAGSSGPWLKKFYRMAKARGLRFDFLAVHVYGPPDPKKFLKKIDWLYAEYGMPIWITEFAVADWHAMKTGKNRYPESKVLEFMKVVLPELEKRPFVERYAWFGAGKHSFSHPQVYTSRLFKKDGSLTELGKFYAGF